MKRHSSASSHGGSRHNVTSPGSAGEHHPLHRPAAGRHRHAKILLPRNHSSGRNLAKMGRQAQQAQQHAYQVQQVAQAQAAQQADDGRKHARQRSHEGDTEIRLPGSLDEERPPMRRNMTASELPRNKSSSKLKKNLSHGQLSRLTSGKNLAALNSVTHKAPPSPGLKGKSKRKSAEMAAQEKDLHEQEVELQRQQQERKEAPKKVVGFAVGSSGDTTEDDDETLQTEGSGLQEDDWTDQSASASPYSTRQNTANNSRRTSVIVDKPPDKPAVQLAHLPVNTETSEPKQPEQAEDTAQQQGPEANGSPAQSHEEEEEEPSPRSQAKIHRQDIALPKDPPQAPSKQQQPAVEPQQPKKQHFKSPLHVSKEHPNPTTKRLVSNQLPAPALVSSVSALDSMHSSIRGSPAPSLRSGAGHDGALDLEQDELVSRFIPSASHPATGSGGNTGTTNTPKQNSFHTPEEDSTLHRAKRVGTFSVGPMSPGSTISGSSGAATPALGRSRIELRMLHDKALADREAAAERQPLVPHHFYDRRNETLKSYLNLAALGGDGRGGLSSTTGLSLGPEIFQGRFKAVNTELKVVQKFHNPVAEAVERLQKCKGTKVSHRSPQKQQTGLKTSKSAVSLPARSAVKDHSKLSTSASPPKIAAPQETSKSVSPQKTAMASAKSSIQIQGGSDRRHPRRGVSFAGTPPETREIARSEEDGGPDAIARSLWNNVGG